MNNVILHGRIGADIEVRYTPSGSAVANFSVATDESYTDKDGTKHEKTEWHRCTAWNRTAEVIAEYCKKGSEILCNGKLQTSEWDDKDGIRRRKTEIVVSRFEFCGSQKHQQQDEEPEPAPAPLHEDDVPF